jgi:hypothetical protein
MLITLISFFASSVISTSWADIIVMDNGMLLNGKLIKETAARYQFTNAYGSFNIRKELVKEIYVTGSYTEDIEIMKKMGAKIDEAVIKKNIEEGMKRKRIEEARAEKKRLERERIEEAEKKQREARAEKKKKEQEKIEAAKKKQKEAEEEPREKIAQAKTIKKLVKGEIEEKKEKPVEEKKKPQRPDYWYFGRLGLEGIYYSTLLTPSLSGRVPHGLSPVLSYDQGLDSIIKKRHMAMPGLRFELGYVDYEKMFLFKSSLRISGYLAQAGPVWAFPSLTNSWGCFVLSTLAGAGYLDIINREASARSRDFHIIAAGIFGYEYSFEIVSLFIHIRYMYIYDQSIVFHAFGGSMGFACRLW